MNGNCDSQNYLRPADVAKELGLGRDTVYSLFHRRDFPAIKVGHSFIICRDSLEDWIKKHEGKEIEL